METWSKDYQTAKENLNSYLSLLKDRNLSFEHSQLDINQKDPYGNQLYIDVIWIGNSDADKLYMSTSGIHGVEGFAGSAIQLSILKKLEKLPDKTALAFVHILNPWGMSWLRRENESSVDLNRNFLTSNEKYEGSHEHYPKLDSLINIKHVPSQNDFFKFKLLIHAMIHGRIKTKQAYAEGQYNFPKGLHFGGHKLEKGPECFIEWLRSHLINIKRCVWIDLHTGLGKSGEDSLLVDLAPDHENFLKLQAQSFGDRIMSLDPKAGIAYRIRGGMQKGVEHFFSGINWTAITQEFGTVPSINVMKALRAENSWTHYSNREGIDLLNHWSKNNLLAAFRPDNDIWENKIIERGLTLDDQALNYHINS